MDDRPRRTPRGVVDAFRGERADALRTLYYIAVSVLAALVPLILFAGFWLRAETQRNESALEGYLAARASSLSQRVDGEIGRQLSVLQAVASLPSGADGTIDGFVASAARIAAAMPEWDAISLVDAASGRQIVSTFENEVDIARALPSVEVARQVAESRRSAVRTLTPPEGGAGVVVLLYASAGWPEALPYVVVAQMSADALRTRVIDEGGPLRNLVMLVLDEQRNVLAHSPRAALFPGTPSGETLRRHTDGRRSGLFTASTFEGHEFYTAFQRSPLTGWLAVVATDRGHLNTLTRGPSFTVVAAGLISLALAGVLAIVLLYNVIQRRVSDERLSASLALGKLDARLLAATQEALAEQRKAASEREVLLREIYHRVKNNLQIIQSLLRLGSRNLEDSEREPFESAIRRIGAMARVHNLLYKSPDLASIDLRDYLDDLVTDVSAAFAARERNIHVAFEAEPMRISLDTAVPLAFIAVELLTNAFRHGFPADRGGTVRITARSVAGQGSLCVEDDGIGLPANPFSGRALGLSIVDKLTGQIGGRFERPQAGSADFCITFPLAAPVALPPLARVGAIEGEGAARP